jgi:hypothetical protein
MHFLSGALYDTFEFTIARVYQPLALIHSTLRSQLFVLGKDLVHSAAPTAKTRQSEGQNNTALPQNLYPSNPPASFILLVDSDLATIHCND